MAVTGKGICIFSESAACLHSTLGSNPFLSLVNPALGSLSPGSIADPVLMERSGMKQGEPLFGNILPSCIAKAFSKQKFM